MTGEKVIAKETISRKLHKDISSLAKTFGMDDQRICPIKEEKKGLYSVSMDRVERRLPWIS